VPFGISICSSSNRLRGVRLSNPGVLPEFHTEEELLNETMVSTGVIGMRFRHLAFGAVAQEFELTDGINSATINFSGTLVLVGAARVRLRPTWLPVSLVSTARLAIIP
jgi:hypothetical protein